MNQRPSLWGAIIVAAIGVFLCSRSIALRNEFHGAVPASGYSDSEADYPNPFEEEILFPGEAGHLLPAFDVSVPEIRPIELKLPVMSCSGPLVFQGEVHHVHPDFPGAIVRMVVESPLRTSRNRPVQWRRIRVEDETTTEEDGRFVFRIEDRPPTDPGRYRIRFEVMHIKLGVDLESLSFGDRTVRVAVAEGMVEFRE